MFWFNVFVIDGFSLDKMKKLGFVLCSVFFNVFDLLAVSMEFTSTYIGNRYFIKCFNNEVPTFKPSLIKKKKKLEIAGKLLVAWKTVGIKENKPPLAFCESSKNSLIWLVSWFLPEVHFGKGSQKKHGNSLFSQKSIGTFAISTNFNVVNGGYANCTY